MTMPSHAAKDACTNQLHEPVCTYCSYAKMPAGTRMKSSLRCRPMPEITNATKMAIGPYSTSLLPHSRRVPGSGAAAAACVAAPATAGSCATAASVATATVTMAARMSMAEV